MHLDCPSSCLSVAAAGNANLALLRPAAMPGDCWTWLGGRGGGASMGLGRVEVDRRCMSCSMTATHEAYAQAHVPAITANASR